MSDEMALSDNVSGYDAKVNGEETAAPSAVEAEAAPAEAPAEAGESATEDEPPTEPAKEIKVEEPSESEPATNDDAVDVKTELKSDPDPEPEPESKLSNEDETDAKGDGLDMELDDDDKRGVKRRASEAFSDEGNDFVGFDEVKPRDLSGYNKVVDRLEAEVTAARKDFTPVRRVMGIPSAPVRASKRARQDTDGSRPSSALSSRSDGDAGSNDGVSSSPLARGGRRATTEMSSPSLRVPLERGWKRELVFRAALDQHSRRNADIYYYSPQGKKLRSTREVAEHLAGTGLTLENFSFFKEPLGVDDPEKEIIRDAKLMRRVESPVAATAATAPSPAPPGKRAPKPKPPKGASPEPVAKDTPAKIKVKSFGSRLSNNGTPPAAKAAKKPAPDNNNSAAWKKPRPPSAASAAPAAPAAPAVPTPETVAPVATVTPVAESVTSPPATTAPPPLQSRPAVQSETEQERPAPPRQLVQPCSLTCGRGVPTLACASCLCLYHPACAGHYRVTPQPFYCKNCRKSSSPVSEPPPLTHKSGAPAALPAPAPRRVPKPETRVLLRMKAASGGPEGERVWAVSGVPQPPPPFPPPQSLPQSIARLNGRRFIVVPRSLLPTQPQIPSDD